MDVEQVTVSAQEPAQGSGSELGSEWAEPLVVALGAAPALGFAVSAPVREVALVFLAELVVVALLVSLRVWLRGRA